jgi:hypothetical protein
MVHREKLLAVWPWAATRRLLTRYGTLECLRAWELMQNLSHSSDEHPGQHALLRWAGGELLPLVCATLEGAAPAPLLLADRRMRAR